MFVGENDVGGDELFEVGNALGLLRLELRAGQNGQQHRREDGNDGDDDQEFNQGEGGALFEG